MRRRVVGVMGGSACDAATAELAGRLGAAVAAAGWVLLCGGRPAGVMAAAARGAAEAGGLVVGVLPGEDPDAADPHVGVAVATGLGWARNAVNVLSSDVVVALPGSWGTLSEIAFARAYGRPLYLLGWERQPLADEVLPLFADLPPLLAELRGRLDS